MHAKLELHFDKDDHLSVHTMVHVGGSGITDAMGEHRVSWIPKSKIEIIQTLRKIVEILEKTLKTDSSSS